MSVCHGYIIVGHDKKSVTCDRDCLDYKTCPIRMYLEESECWSKKLKPKQDEEAWSEQKHQIREDEQ